VRPLFAAALLLAACRPVPDTGDTAFDTGDTGDTAPPDLVPVFVVAAPAPRAPRASHPSPFARLAAAMLPAAHRAGEGRKVGGDIALHTPSDLRALRGVTRIEGALRVRGTDLADLSGLEELERAGDLEIVGNPALTDLSALRNLRRVDGMLHLDDNPSLRDLSGLERLEEVGGEVAILNNPALVDLSALGSLTRIGLERGWCGRDAPVLAIFHNGLASLAGLEGLRAIHGPVNVHDNGAIPAATQRAVAVSLPALPCTAPESAPLHPPRLRPELPAPPSVWEPMVDESWRAEEEP